MTEKHKRGRDGLLEDGVSHYPADAHDMQTVKTPSTIWRNCSACSDSPYESRWIRNARSACFIQFNSQLIFDCSDKEMSHVA